MPEDNRVDLSGELDGLLKDIKAATDEVKARQDADKVKQAKTAESASTRKIQTIIIAAAAVVLVVIAYFVVFARGPETAGQSQTTTRQTPAPIQMTAPPKAQPGPTATPRTPSAPAPRHDSQVVDDDSDGYEQPM